MDLLSIKDPSFLRDLSKKELKELCKEIREFLIENVSKTGGHLSSNLGIVELTVAMLYVFNDKNDKFIFDVGHQSYTYKILTGRASEFVNLRKFNGLSGFINYDESEYDVFESGHSSTSISALSGFLIAKENGEKINDCVAIIGDASISNGEAFEGLNFLSTFKNERPIVILNDNQMAISKMVGGTSHTFEMLRRSKFYHGLKATLCFIFPKFVTNWFHKVKKGLKAFFQHDNYFEDLNLDYFGPYNGNNISECIRVLERAKKSKEPVIIHLYTKKGLGYKFAEKDEEGKFHGVSAFDINTGKSLKVWKENEISYSEAISRTILKLKCDKKIVCVTPAMIVGSRLKKLKETFPHSIYDVGIAEEHAASMCAALALNNQRPILFMYSTFAQRAYDQILNDISRRKLAVTICIDRAGIVSGDGSTHQGIYDVAMFLSMPNMIICQGKNLRETEGLLKYITTINYPSVIRFPKKADLFDDNVITIDNFNWDVLKKGQNVVISYGPDILNILKLVEDNNFDLEVVNARFINPLDTDYLESIKGKKVLVYEQVCENGGLFSQISSYNEKFRLNLTILQMAIPQNALIPCGDVDSIKKLYNLDDEYLLKELKALCD